MTRSLNGKVAVVTGAGSGIGRGIAIRLAEDTAKIAIWDINAVGAAETARLIEEAGGTAIALDADCSDKAAIHAAAEETRTRLGPIAILVNNAGIAPFTPFMDIEDDLFDKTVHINLRGPYLLTKEVLPDMLAAGWGRVVNITSSSVQSGSFAQVHYVSSKGGLMGMTKALALEFAASGVTFNMVPPGFIDTPMLRSAPIDVDAFAQTLPMKRVGTPEDIAAAVAYLASEEASYITGQTISTNGGRYMGSH
ncbi:SDR family NAD(P)-dependent oxidoreductase [Sphingobium boeckii]|uniref:2-hydroxycyclohexanecarboxyl-CoA dehydrogenase n=1 Tax=Sphingobium boeckii TaxID=1082345 RepID=A0A7W9AJN7_9SPHN|nr:SDR family NAD(P)-dependent oxidoreductase [Sphingobium boeckii]MBB5686696.1 2-hydroxycyclohexanecarboxyl-CoA dehydrogenase [Sphingobium boeckii]